MSTQSPQLQLPPIALDALSPRGKDYLIAMANKDNVTPTDAFIRLLDRAAARAGFRTTPASNQQRKGESV